MTTLGTLFIVFLGAFLLAGMVSATGPTNMYPQPEIVGFENAAFLLEESNGKGRLIDEHEDGEDWCLEVPSGGFYEVTPETAIQLIEEGVVDDVGDGFYQARLPYSAPMTYRA